MKFCLPLAFCDASQWPSLARSAEAAGFHGIVLSDHLFYPKRLETRYPYTENGQPLWEQSTPWPDPLIAVAALAGVTERIRFLTSIYIVPLRHPVASAKLIASAEVFAPGRLTLGVGAGWMREEFAVMGQPFERRGTRMMEAIDAMQKLWAGGMVEHHGEFFDFEPLQISPVPTAPIPIWGGGTSDVALRRAGRHFDGWVSTIQRTAEIHAFVPKLLGARAHSPRAGHCFDVCAAVADAYTLDAYAALGEVGVTQLMTVPWLLYGVTDDDLQKKCDAVRRFGDEVIAPMNESR